MKEDVVLEDRQRSPRTSKSKAVGFYGYAELDEPRLHHECCDDPTDNHLLPYHKQSRVFKEAEHGHKKTGISPRYPHTELPWSDDPNIFKLP